MHMYRRLGPGLAVAMIALVPVARGQDDAPAGTEPSVSAGAPVAVAALHATDHPWDDGEVIDLSWEASPDDAALENYYLYRSVVKVGDYDIEPEFELIEPVSAGQESYEYEAEASSTITLPDIAKMRDRFDFDALHATGRREYPVTYVYQIVAVTPDGARSAATNSAAVRSTVQVFAGDRFWLLVIVAIFCGAVIYWIRHARAGKPVWVRKIAGLEAVDEAVGRATEMGRSVLFVPGIQDINEIQTIAGITILARVAKTAAEYDAKVEVPTSRSLVMTTARETVQAAFLAAGRPDAYNKDLIYYVTDEQFGYVAYLQGMMVREKPATCFYMGAFFAESLILAETGNSIGAIQIAGTAQPAQLPFFVAACDYTLIGEEFFAASAYLSGSAEEMGSLKGQDVGKIVVAVIMAVGIAMATLGSMTGSDTLNNAVSYLKNTLLT